MATAKSEIIKQLSRNYPNFPKKNLIKLFNIIIEEIVNALKRNERVELRDLVMLEAKKYKSKYARNPKNNEKIFVPEKKIVRFKCSKKWLEIINEKK